jgi:hypothetical protein
MRAANLDLKMEFVNFLSSKGLTIDDLDRNGIKSFGSMTLTLDEIKNEFTQYLIEIDTSFMFSDKSLISNIINFFIVNKDSLFNDILNRPSFQNPSEDSRFYPSSSFRSSGGSCSSSIGPKK